MSGVLLPRWILDQAPGPRIVVAVEGTRSDGVGLARALQAAGLPVVESERPRRRERRGGKSDPIDARLAAVHALRLDADRLPTPRADGDREALRILLGARRELTSDKTRMVNRLRALLLTGCDADWVLARGSMSIPTLTKIIRRRGRPEDSREQAVRRAEARRPSAGHPGGKPGSGGEQKTAGRTGDRACTPIVDQGGRRSSQCRAGHRVLVSPRPLPQRRRLRRARRSQPHPSQQRADHPPPA